MTLLEYTQSLANGDRKRFRRQVLDTTQVRPAAWYQWLNQTTRPSPRNARIIEALSDGALSIYELRPHDFVISDHA